MGTKYPWITLGRLDDYEVFVNHETLTLRARCPGATYDISASCVGNHEFDKFYNDKTQAVFRFARYLYYRYMWVRFLGYVPEPCDAPMAFHYKGTTTIKGAPNA